MRRIWIGMALVAAGAAAPRPAGAQTAGLDAARVALAECVRAVESPDSGETQQPAAKAAAARAEKAFRALVAAEPKSAEAHAGLGEAIARCGIPQAGMSSIMNLVESATQSLQQALALDPEHWQARFVLAQVFGGMPAFLNKGPDAIRELETLRAQQGTRNDRPHYALTWLRLGDVYRKAGRTGDAQAAYAAGAKLFPTHEELKRRAEEAGAPSPEALEGAQSSPAATSPAVYALTALRVEAGQHQLEEARSAASLRRMDVVMMPGGTGEMLQTLQALPGATRAGDGADLYVRGGDPEETPIFVNGGRMAFPGRWESLGGMTMGVLDANVLSKAYFSAGGFSVKYGNALSGIVDVESQGRPQEARWRIGANLVSLGGGAHQPLNGRAGAWGALLLTDVSLLARTQGQQDLYPGMPRSYQAVLGGSYDAASTVELKAVALASGDESSRVVDAGGHHGAFASTGQTQHGGFSGRWLRADGRAGVGASVTASRRSGGYRFGILERDRSDAAYGTRLDGDLVSAGSARLRAGIELTHFTGLTEGRVPLTPSVAPGSPSVLLDGAGEHATHLGAYLESEKPLGANMIAVVGMRADRLPGEADVSLDPRAALAYTSGIWTLRAAAGVFHQGAWRRKYQLPDPGTPSGVPTRARHVVLGAERAGEPSVRAEAFTKHYDRFAAGGGDGPHASAGVTRGLEGMVRWQRQSRLNGWITYSLLDAQLELEDGTTAAAKYDVTHSLTAVARLSLGDAWELGASARYASGKPYTPVLGTVPAPEDGWPAAPIYGATHAGRLPYYGRLDGRITRYQRIGEHMGVFYLEMLDLTGRRNVIGYQYDATYSERKPVESFFARRTFVAGAELQFR